jgi:fructose-1-phosphate kinase PfkB-like protein
MIHPASWYFTPHSSVDLSEGHDLAPEPGGGGNNGAVAEALVNLYLELIGQPHVISFCGERDQQVFHRLKLFGIEVDLVTVPGDTRVNRILRALDGSESVRYGPRMKIDFEALERFIAKVTGLPAGARVAISGSLPDGMTPEFIVNLLAMLIGWKEASVLIDAKADIVKTVLDSPFRDYIATIKQNDEEFGALVGEGLSYKTAEGRKIFNIDQLLRLTDGLLDHGELVVTLGKQGIFLRSQGRAWRIIGALPSGFEACTTNRCGDAWVGGFQSAKNAGLDRILDLTQMGLPEDFATDPAAPIVLAAMLGVAAATANTSTRQQGFDLKLLDEIFRHHLTTTEVTARATVPLLI